MIKLRQLMIVHKTTVILVGVMIVLVILGYFGWQKFATQTGQVEEVDLAFDAEGPYALLFPRRDGNALILNIKRTSSYSEISYDLAYTSKEESAVSGTKVLNDGEGQMKGSIDRGVSGQLDTKDKKGEIELEILFGTCSKNVCKYDQGVENGTLTLRIRARNKLYRMITTWHLQKPDMALGVLTSGDTHFTYQLETDREVLSTTGFTIINDLTGVPKLPFGKVVLGKVYSLNVPIAKDLMAGAVTLELAENAPADAKLYRYNINNSKWEQLETKIEGSKLSAKANGAGIFAVLISN